MPNLTHVPAFGYETKTSHAKNTSHTKSSWKSRNIRKGLGSIPVIGIAFGIMQLVSIAKSTRQHWITPNKAKWILRGTLQALSLGFLLFIPDLIITALREQKKSLPAKANVPVSKIPKDPNIPALKVSFEANKPSVQSSVIPSVRNNEIQVPVLPPPQKTKIEVKTSWNMVMNLDPKNSADKAMLQKWVNRGDSNAFVILEFKTLSSNKEKKQFLEKMALEGHPLAIYILYDIENYMNPQMKLDLLDCRDNCSEALKNALKNGSHYAQLNIAELEETINKVFTKFKPDRAEKAFELALEKLRTLAQDGNQEAQFDLGIIYIKKLSKPNLNMNEGISWLEKAADAGNIPAIKELWKLSISEELAKKLFKKTLDLAKKNDLWCIEQIIRCYLKGKGILKDNSKAFLFFQRMESLEKNEEKLAPILSEMYLENVSEIIPEIEKRVSEGHTKMLVSIWEMVTWADKYSSKEPEVLGWIQKAAAQGDQWSIQEVTRRSENSTETLFWLKKWKLTEVDEFHHRLGALLQSEEPGALEFAEKKAEEGSIMALKALFDAHKTINKPTHLETINKPTHLAILDQAVQSGDVWAIKTRFEIYFAEKNFSKARECMQKLEPTSSSYTDFEDRLIEADPSG